MTNMSRGYEPVIIKFRSKLAETLLTKLQKEIVLQYKSLLAGQKCQTFLGLPTVHLDSSSQVVSTLAKNLFLWLWAKEQTTN